MAELFDRWTFWGPLAFIVDNIPSKSGGRRIEIEPVEGGLANVIKLLK